MRRAGIPQVIRMKISGHKTDSMERRYNIVDAEDLQMAKELLQNRRRTPENTGNVTKTVTTAGKTAIPGDTAAADKISYLGLQDTRRYRRFWLEVLAGAISWGFKSPSPHQISAAVSIGYGGFFRPRPNRAHNNRCRGVAENMLS